MVKKFLKDDTNFEIEGELTLKELAKDHVGIPPTESGICFVVNGRVKHNTSLLEDGDKIVILKMGGAGQPTYFIKYGPRLYNRGLFVYDQDMEF